MIPPGGQTVMKPHGTNRFTPVFLAALARGIWSCCSAGPTQLITTSIPANASMSCSSGAFKSHFRIWHPRSWRRVIAGFWAEIGRTRAMTSYLAKIKAISLGSIGRPGSWTYKVTSIQQSVGDRTSGFTRCSDEQNLGGHNNSS